MQPPAQRPPVMQQPPAQQPPAMQPPAMQPAATSASCANPATDAIAILQKNCVLCHNPMNPATYAANLDLFNAGAKGRLLNASSRTCAGRILIQDRPEGVVGHLFDKVSGMAPMGCGDRMPPFGSALSAADIKCLKDWIRPTP